MGGTEAGGVVQGHYLMRKTQNLMPEAAAHNVQVPDVVKRTKPGKRRREAALEAVRHRDKEILSCIEAWEALQPPGHKGVTREELPGLLLHLNGTARPGDIQRVICNAKDVTEECDDDAQDERAGGAEMLACTPPPGDVETVSFSDRRTGFTVRFAPSADRGSLELSIKGAPAREPVKEVKYLGDDKLGIGDGRVCVLPHARLPQILGMMRALCDKAGVSCDVPSTVPAARPASKTIPTEDLPRVLGQVYQTYHPQSLVLTRTVDAVDAALDEEPLSRLSRSAVRSLMARLNDGSHPEEKELEVLLQRARPDPGGAPSISVVAGKAAPLHLSDAAGYYLQVPSAGLPTWRLRRRRYAYYAGSALECAPAPTRHTLTRREVDALRLRFDASPHPSGARFVALADAGSLRKGVRVAAVCGHDLQSPGDLEAALAALDQRGVWEMDVDVLNAAGAHRRISLTGSTLSALPARPPQGQTDRALRHPASFQLREAGDGSVQLSVLTGGEAVPVSLRGENLVADTSAEAVRVRLVEDRFWPGFTSLEICDRPATFVAAPADRDGGALTLARPDPDRISTAVRAGLCFTVTRAAWRVTDDMHDLSRPQRRGGQTLPGPPHELEEGSYQPASGAPDVAGMPAVVNGEPVWVEDRVTVLQPAHDGTWHLTPGGDGRDPIAVSAPHNGSLPHELPPGSWLDPSSRKRLSVKVYLAGAAQAEAIYEKEKLRRPLQDWYVEQAGEDHSSAHCFLDGPDGECNIL
eukprot:TRINITY_DN20932_c0_g1_i1.p1 TRINITY_DN20932_c0_g1~~TRINITY_DN20932_c0_g1_i1.p1  ORF type:complete len:790 (+),score=240.36 TRINITY_DN20932_c0_g1_i1:115-2370(+)